LGALGERLRLDRQPKRRHTWGLLGGASGAAPTTPGNHFGKAW
jgi:hypothetical protein